MNVSISSTNPVPVDPEAQLVRTAGSTGWGGILSSIFGVLSFGLVPAFAWAGKFAEIAQREHDRFRGPVRFAASLGSSPATTKALNVARDRMRPVWFFTVATYALVAYVGVAVAMQLPWRSMGLDQLIAYTYSFHDYVPEFQFNSWNLSDYADAERAQAVHALWCVALSLAYGAQWVQVRRHAKAVRRFVNAFNEAVEPRGVLPVQMPDHGGWHPSLIVGAVVFGAAGVWWGIPMLLAASAQRRYTLLTRRSLAVQFADRMSKTAAKRAVERRCETKGCQTLLVPQAKFCPQCGSRVPAPMIDQMG